MPRQARHAPPGLYYHVMNRTAGKFIMLRRDADFQALERTMLQAHQREPIPILAWCLMGNHWHFVVRPEKEGQLTAFFRWLTMTHALRWRVAHRTSGYGHLYRGRFKAFPVQPGGHLQEVLRYVERNPLSAGEVSRAQDWHWSSLHVRDHGPDELRQILAPWPVPRPANWTNYVNQPITPREYVGLELSEERERPYGDDRWVRHTARQLDLEYTLRERGRPPHRRNNASPTRPS